MEFKQFNSSLTVSFGILCYNQENDIGRVIESALQQTHPVEEILVIDDGSTDDSRKIINNYPGVKLVAHAQNRGRAAARTTVLETAYGDIVVYLDGDTPAAPDLVAHLLTEYTAPEIGAVGAIVIETNITTVYDRWRARHGTYQELANRNKNAALIFGWGFSCRRELGLQLGGFRRASEDIDMCLRIRQANYRIIQTPLARVYHLRSDDYRSLMQMIYRWWFGGYVAFARNGATEMRPHFVRLWNNLIGSLFHDLFIQRDLGIALIDLLIVPSQIRGILDGNRFMRTGASNWEQIPGL